MDQVKKDRLYYGWVVVATTLFIGILSMGIRYSYGIFFKSLQQDFNWSRTLTSGVFSGYMLLSCLFAMLGGWVQDRCPSKAVIFFMGIFTGLSLLLTSYANSPWHLFISYSLLLAMGTGPNYTVTMAIISKWFLKRRVLAVAIAGCGFGLGIIMMPPLAAYLVSHYGWQSAYFKMGLIALFTIPPSALFLKDAPNDISFLPDGEKLATTQFDRFQEYSLKESKDFSLFQAVKTQNFWLLFFIWLFYSSCFHLVLTHLAPYAMDSGISSMKAATILTILGATNTCGRLLMGRVAGTIGLKMTAIISALFIAGAMLLLVKEGELWVLYIFGIVFGLSFGGLDPPVTALIGDVFGLRHLGVIIGALAIGFGVGAAIGPALGGYIFDVSGKYFFAFLLSAVSMIIVAVMILLIEEPKSQRRLLSGH